MAPAPSGADPLEMLRAWIYLNGILPLFEDLVAFDQEAAAAIAGQNLVVQFEVRHGPVAHLDIDDGEIRYGTGRDSRPDVRLTFKTPERLNRMFGGEKVRPGLRKGFRHIRFLMCRFPTLAERLSYYLEGDGSSAGDAETRRFLVGLRLRAMLGGTAAVAGHDPWLADVADHLPETTLQLRVLPDGPEGTVAKVVTNGGHDFVAGYGIAAAYPNAVLEFASVDSAWRVLNGEAGFEESAGLGEVRLAGNVGLADQMNIFMQRLVSVLGL
jgi:hypothetical protein